MIYFKKNYFLVQTNVIFPGNEDSYQLLQLTLREADNIFVVCCSCNCKLIIIVIFVKCSYCN